MITADDLQMSALDMCREDHMYLQVGPKPDCSLVPKPYERKRLHRDDDAESNASRRQGMRCESAADDPQRSSC